MFLILIGLMCITTLSVNATPILMFRDELDLLEIKDDNSSFKNRFIELLSCCMCLGFWIGFIYMLLHGNGIIISLLYGSIISIGSELLNKLLRY